MYTSLVNKVKTSLRQISQEDKLSPLKDTPQKQTSLHSSQFSKTDTFLKAINSLSLHVFFSLTPNADTTKVDFF